MLGSLPAENNQPIDAVVTWVDGSDPEFLKRMEPFLEGKDRSTIPGAHPTRFASINEIRYCILSILTFAPFVRKIFIVTAGQDPNLYNDIKKYFPERVDSIKIVDHSEIFRGFEQYLPVFNSRSIECMIWRINGLADQFIYFNDDTFLIRETRPQDWFVNGRPVLRGKWIFLPAFRIIWKWTRIFIHKVLLKNKDYRPRPSFHVGQWLAASLVGFKFRYLAFCHTPHAVSRKMAENFFFANHHLLEKTISHRFRNHKQFNFLALSYHLEILNGNSNIRKSGLLYLQPRGRAAGYFDRKIRIFGNNPDIKFLCVQSLEMCNREEQEKIFKWLDGSLKLPELKMEIKENEWKLSAR